MSVNYTEGLCVDTVFDLFDLTDYTFLEVSRGGIEGNVIINETQAEGVFKLRSGMNVASDQETKTSDATLHIKPDEPFSSNLMGNGVRVFGNEYEIVGATGGMNFETGEMEHYRVTLQATEFTA